MKIIGFKEQYSNSEIVKRVLKGFRYNFTQNEVIEFFSKNEKELLNLFSDNNQNRLYKGIDRDVYLFFILDYVQKEKLFEKKALPDIVVKNIEKARRHEYVDYSYIKKIKDTTLNCLSNIEHYSNFDYQLSKEFEEAVLKDIPQNYSKIERAFYIYLKLCTLLRYNEEYYIMHHSNRNYSVGTTNLEKVINGTINEVVCFEFCNLFNYFMIKEQNFVETSDVRMFGQTDAHNKSFIVVDNFFIEVDSTRGIFGGDLTNAKFGNQLLGFNLRSEKNKFFYDFNTMLAKVYSEFKKNNKLPSNTIEVYNMLKQMISDIGSLEISESVKKRVISYLSHLYEHRTEAMDFLSNNLCSKYYALNIKEEDIKITFISKKIKRSEKTSVVMSIKTNNDGYYYLELESDNLRFVSKEELEEKLEAKEYKLLNEGMCSSFISIPGIGYYDGKRKILGDNKRSTYEE